MIEVRLVKGMGRGLFATEDIEVRNIIHSAEFIKVKDSEVEKCPTLDKYVFRYSNKYSALCLGLGSLFNHSDEPNAEVCFDIINGRELMVFSSIVPIKKGEQIFISYGDDSYRYYNLVNKKK